MSMLENSWFHAVDRSVLSKYFIGGRRLSASLFYGYIKQEHEENGSVIWKDGLVPGRTLGRYWDTWHLLCNKYTFGNIVTSTTIKHTGRHVYIQYIHNTMILVIHVHQHYWTTDHVLLYESKTYQLQHTHCTIIEFNLHS